MKKLLATGCRFYKYQGKQFVGFAGFKNHIGFYPMSGSFVEEYRDELKGFETSKGAVQFPLNEPLPVSLIKKLLKARMKENDLLQ